MSVSVSIFRSQHLLSQWVRQWLKAELVSGKFSMMKWKTHSTQDRRTGLFLLHHIRAGDPGQSPAYSGPQFPLSFLTYLVDPHDGRRGKNPWKHLWMCFKRRHSWKAPYAHGNLGIGGFSFYSNLGLPNLGSVNTWGQTIVCYKGLFFPL